MVVPSLMLVATLPLAVGVEPNRLNPGEPLRVTVTAPGPDAAISGAFLGQELTFLLAPDGERWVAFAGVDLQAEPGVHSLEVRLRRPGGAVQSRTFAIQVEPKEFPTERLTVSREYVEPPPEVSERIAREAAALRAIWGRATQERLFDGAVKPPLDGAPGRNFGRRRIFNGQPRSPHSGTDLSAPEGTAVEAAARGRVVLAEDLYFSGNLVVLDHGGGVYTLYAHLSSLDVAVGDTVAAGNLVGRVGATGRVTGSHLHWGARIGRARVDPSSLLQLLNF